MGVGKERWIIHYLNEWDAFAAQWCRNLAEMKQIPACEVDETDIRKFTGDRLNGYSQCHFFAGIGGWPLALRLAGVPEDASVWTASCPCQPFSRIGKKQGTDDERHLWPEFRRLYRLGRPQIMFGEQVAGKDGIEWLKAVRDDLQEDGYATASAVLRSPLVEKDHDRPRIYWGAWSARDFRPVRFASDCDQFGYCPECGIDYAECECPGPTEDGVVVVESDGGLFGCRLADSDNAGQQAGRGTVFKHQWDDSRGGGICNGSQLVYPSGAGPQGHGRDGNDKSKPRRNDRLSGGSIATPSGDVCLVECENGKWRCFQSGSFPMAYGIPSSLGRGKSELDRLAKNARANRNGRIKGYGNAIVPELAAVFIECFFEAIYDLANQ